MALEKSIAIEKSKFCREIGGLIIFILGGILATFYVVPERHSILKSLYTWVKLSMLYVLSHREQQGCLKMWAQLDSPLCSYRNLPQGNIQ